MQWSGWLLSVVLGDALSPVRLPDKEGTVRVGSHAVELTGRIDHFRSEIMKIRLRTKHVKCQEAVMKVSLT